MPSRQPSDGQLGLFAAAEPTRPRPDTPAVKLPTLPRPTQVHAAGRTLPTTGSKRSMLLEMFRSRHRYGDGYTDAELVRLTRWPENTVRPRRVELEQAGWIKDSGRTRPTPTGSQATVWIFVADDEAEVRTG